MICEFSFPASLFSLGVRVETTVLKGGCGKCMDWWTRNLPTPVTAQDRVDLLSCECTLLSHVLLFPHSFQEWRKSWALSSCIFGSPRDENAITKSLSSSTTDVASLLILCLYKEKVSCTFSACESQLIFTSLCQMCSYSAAETILSLLTLYSHFIFTLILFPKLSLNYELPGGPG